MQNHSLWANRSRIPADSLTATKVALGLIIAVTAVVPLFFVQFDDATLRINVFKFLAKIGAFVGSVLLVWQFFLGFRGAVSSVFPDLSWVVDLHKALGKFGVPIILLHPVFIGLYYLESRGTNIYALELDGTFSQLVLVGMVLLGIIAFIVITSAFLRERLGFYPWLYTHLSSYLVPPLLFVHSFLLGPTIQETPLRYYWWFIAGATAALYIYRVAHKLGVFAARYRVARSATVAEQTTEIILEPENRPLGPRLGQFVYLRETIPENSHPYTVSSFDEETGALGLTAKEEGPQSARLQRVEAGERFLLDGPFGVFTRIARVTDLPIVMVAGGIGITPFRRLWRELERDRSREAHLFYGNELYSDIAFREELDSLEHVHVVHVLNQEPDFPGEKGFVTVEVLRRNLPRPLADYQFMICGPPVMILKLESALKEAGIPGRHIRHELFAN